MTYRVPAAPVRVGQIPRASPTIFGRQRASARELERTLLDFCRTWGYQDVLLPTFDMLTR